MLSNVTPRSDHHSQQYMPPGYGPLAQSEHSGPENVPSARQTEVQEHVRNGAQRPAPESKARLRKACDSCSIRKVKVCCSSTRATRGNNTNIIEVLSVMRQDPHVEHALA